MKITEKTFVSPILAQAFIDGITFSNNINLTCRIPRRDSAVKWVVVIEDETEDQPEVSIISGEDQAQTKKPINDTVS